MRATRRVPQRRDERGASKDDREAIDSGDFGNGFAPRKTRHRCIELCSVTIQIGEERGMGEKNGMRGVGGTKSNPCLDGWKVAGFAKGPPANPRESCKNGYSRAQSLLVSLAELDPARRCCDFGLMSSGGGDGSRQTLSNTDLVNANVAPQHSFVCRSYRRMQVVLLSSP